jgi:hypothetical protein
MMTKRFLPALLASAVLLLTMPACGPSTNEGDDDVATPPLPPLPAAPDTTKGAKAPTPTANDPTRELTAPNATEDIKKMQPQM